MNTCTPPVPVPVLVTGPVGATGPQGATGPMPSVGTMALQDSNDVSISGGYISGIEILGAKVRTLDVQRGYPAGGSIPLRFDVDTLNLIELSTNAVFSVAVAFDGGEMILLIRNTTAGSLSITWPSWIASGGLFPSSLSSGQSMIVHAYATGNTEGSVYAMSSL